MNTNLQMVVWLKTLPYRVPRARPTSAWVKPNLIRRCLNCLANASRSSEKPTAENCSEYRVENIGKINRDRDKGQSKINQSFPPIVKCCFYSILLLEEK